MRKGISLMIFLVIAVLAGGCGGRIMSLSKAMSPLDLPETSKPYRVLVFPANKAHAIAASVGVGMNLGIKDNEDDNAFSKTEMFGNLLYLNNIPVIITLDMDYKLTLDEKAVICSRAKNKYQMSPDGKKIYGMNHEKFSWENIKTIREYVDNGDVEVWDVEPGSEKDKMLRDMHAKLLDRFMKMKIPGTAERILERTGYVSSGDVAANTLLPVFGLAYSVGMRAVDAMNVISGEADISLSINEDAPMTRMEVAEALVNLEERSQHSQSSSVSPEKIAKWASDNDRLVKQYEADRVLWLKKVNKQP